MSTTKILLFSVTAADCNWAYTRGTGAGGQKKNKTSSAVHCTHKISGAHGYSEETRSQAKNREIAFTKMTQTDTFKNWHRAEILRRTGEQALLDAELEKQLKKIKVEHKNENGLWEEWNEQ